MPAAWTAARPRQACYQTRGDPIPGTGHDDGYRGGEFLQCQGRIHADSHQDIRVQLHQFRRETWKALGLAIAKAPLDHQVLALDIAQIAHSPHECTQIMGIERGRARKRCQKADAPDFALLLRERAQWRRERTSGKGQ